MYCKLNKQTNELILPPVNDYERGILNYDSNIEQLIEDGYKLFIENPPQPSIRKNHVEYEETEQEILEVIIWEETQEEAEERIANEEKQAKENELEEKIKKLEVMVTDEILFGNDENIQIYRDIIQGLKDTKNNL